MLSTLNRLSMIFTALIVSKGMSGEASLKLFPSRQENKDDKRD